MSRRKNAGQGYGYDFHGAFTEKEDAVRKEKKTPGSFIKGRPTQHGYRWIVMSPRKNPRKPRRRAISRELFVGDRKFRTWPAAFKAARKIAEKTGDKVQVLVREDGTELRHWIEPSGRANPSGLKPFTKAQEKAVYLYRHMTGQYPGTKLSEAQEWKVRMKLAKLNAKHDWSMAQVAEASRLNYWPEPTRNPGELIVLGANPIPKIQELELPAGSTITIRTNPCLQSNPVCGAAIGSGHSCSRKPGHRGPHLPQGATLRPRTRLPGGWVGRRRNPSAAAIREEFTGRPSDGYQVQDVPGIPAGDYAQLGELLALHVKPISGGQVQTIDFRKGERPLLVCDESRRQLYFLNGDQDVSEGLPAFGIHHSPGHEPILLGQLKRIDYKQRKEHAEQPELDEWRHDLGEETGVRPEILFDPALKQLLLRGGEYEVRREGIVN